MERSALRHDGDVGCLALRRDQLNRLTGDAVVLAFVRRRECPRFDVAAGLATDQALTAPTLTRNLVDAELAQSETARYPKGVIQVTVVFQTIVPGSDQIRVSACW